MRVIPTKLPGVVMIEPAVYGDSRGFFTETYNQQSFQAQGLAYEFVQDNHSLSSEAGTLRGLHYQRDDMAQTKLVRVPVGAVYDVAVDIRKDSATYGQWVGVILSADNHRQLLIPKGFAHGFCTLVPNTHVMYKVDQFYSAEHDAGIAWDDADLAIEWPMTKVILSEKDKKHPRLSEV